MNIVVGLYLYIIYLSPGNSCCVSLLCFGILLVFSVFEVHFFMPWTCWQICEFGFLMLYMALFSTTICPEWSDHKRSTLSTGVNTPKLHLRSYRSDHILRWSRPHVATFFSILSYLSLLEIYISAVWEDIQPYWWAGSREGWQIDNINREDRDWRGNPIKDNVVEKQQKIEVLCDNSGSKCHINTKMSEPS